MYSGMELYHFSLCAPVLCLRVTGVRLVVQQGHMQGHVWRFELSIYQAPWNSDLKMEKCLLNYETEASFPQFVLRIKGMDGGGGGNWV